MLAQIAKTVNLSRFPLKQGTFPAPGPTRALLVRPIRSLILVVPIQLTVLYANCRMTEKTEKTQIPATQAASQTNDVTTIHRRAIAIDMHADTPQHLLD